MKQFDDKIVTLSSGISEVPLIPTRTTNKLIVRLLCYCSCNTLCLNLMALETHRNERCVFIKVCKSVKMKFEAIMYNK